MSDFLSFIDEPAQIRYIDQNQLFLNAEEVVEDYWRGLILRGLTAGYLFKHFANGRNRTPLNVDCIFKQKHFLLYILNRKFALEFLVAGKNVLPVYLQQHGHDQASEEHLLYWLVTLFFSFVYFCWRECQVVGFVVVESFLFDTVARRVDGCFGPEFKFIKFRKNSVNSIIVNRI